MNTILIMHMRSFISPYLDYIFEYWSNIIYIYILYTIKIYFKINGYHEDDDPYVTRLVSAFNGHPQGSITSQIIIMLTNYIRNHITKYSGGGGGWGDMNIFE